VKQNVKTLREDDTNKGIKMKSWDKKMTKKFEYVKIMII
jgi:hypothetical protein